MAKGDVETYCENGRWSTRRIGITDPFAAPAAGTGDQTIEKGRRDAALYGVAHLIRHEDGTLIVDTPATRPGHRMSLSV
jgi:hypothetical protein